MKATKDALAQRRAQLPPTQQFSPKALGIATLSSEEKMYALLHELHRRCDHRGSDVRVDVGKPYRFNAWPRDGLDTNRWVWRHPVATRWQRAGHINVLELSTILLAMRWRVRASHSVGTRVCFCVDSQVAIAVAAKCRSSSKMLNQVVRRICAHTLATFTMPFYIYVHTSMNPADGPSRLADAAAGERPVPLL